MSGFFEDRELFQQHAAQDPPLPRVVQLELTADCNLRCVFCPLQSEPRERAPYERRIELNDLQTVLRPLLAHAYEVELTGFGEAFCHPDLLAVLRYFKSLGLTVNATSNGMLWRQELLEPIVAEGLIDLMCVSVDAGAAETYARLRAGGDFNRVKENLALLSNLRSKHERVAPVLHLSFISLVDNLPELPDVVRLAKRVGAACVVVQGLFENDHTRGRGAANSPDEAAVFAAAADIAAREHIALEFWYQRQGVLAEGEVVRKVQVTSPSATDRAAIKDCRYPWERVFVKSNLDVQACATLWEKLVLGNLRRQSIEEIWQGEAYRELRRRLAGTNPPVECHTCPTKPWRCAKSIEEMADRVVFGDRSTGQLGQGFYDVESMTDGRRFRWTAGRGTFFVRNSHRPFLDLEFYPHPRMPGGAITLRVNEETADMLRPDQVNTSPLRFVLPHFSEPVLQVDFEFDRPFTPLEIGDGPSRRTLGVMMVQAALTGNIDDLSDQIRVGRNCDRHVGRGFFPIEQTTSKPMRWTGDRASFAIAHGRGNYMEIELWTIGKLAEQRVSILVGGVERNSVVLPDRAGRTLVRAALGDRKPWHVVTLCCETSWAPGGDDTRRLGVLFAGARVVRGPDVPWWRRRK